MKKKEGKYNKIMKTKRYKTTKKEDETQKKH